MKVNEIFKNLQGEGQLSGQLTTFIRLIGCNLRCSWCISKDTKILTKTGEKLIQDISFSDILKTPNGYTVVNDVMKRKVNKIYEIILKDGRKIRCSEDHPFVVDNKAIPAHKLNKGDKLMIVKWKQKRQQN